jgi:iron-sulfur cluster repair protein YtfE (RIC family)
MGNHASRPGVPCEAEWASRSLTVLVGHISRRYRRPVQQRIEAIRQLIDEVCPGCEGAGRAELARAGASFARLRTALARHTWLEDEFLFRVMPALEFRAGDSDRRVRDVVCQLVATVGEEHSEIRGLLDDLDRVVAELSLATTTAEEALLVADLEMLRLLMQGQMDLEDRCLWPRVRQLLQSSTA